MELKLESKRITKDNDKNKGFFKVNKIQIGIYTII